LRSFGKLAVLLLLPAARASCQDAPHPWPKIEKLFMPPDEYKGKFGDYRSVLKFDDRENGRQSRSARPLAIAGFHP
jgi:hypothetical protein